METRLELEILSQPDDSTCGPTCLHSVYHYHGDGISLDDVIRQVHYLETGGTLAVLLACHALRRGYKATIYTYNLNVFDPTWFTEDVAHLRNRLTLRAQHHEDKRLRVATSAYLEYLDLGGVIKFEDLSRSLIRHHLKRGVPILTGLSATYLYRSMRAYGENDDYDDVRGNPTGHFVVLCGYDAESKRVQIADPIRPDQYALGERYYEVEIDRLIGAIFLGIVTYDANLLLIEPSRATRKLFLAERSK